MTHKDFDCERANIERVIAEAELDEPLRTIIAGRMFWYRKYSQRHKWAFRLCSLAVILINASIAIISALDGNWLKSILPVLVIVINSAIMLFNMQSNWKSYRSTLEKLRSEIVLYVYKVGLYAKCHNNCSIKKCMSCPDNSRKTLFAERVISIIDSENASWVSQQNKSSCENNLRS